MPITDSVICVCEYEKSVAESYGFTKKKLDVIYNGVPEISEKLDLINPYDPNLINVLFVGRFDHQKGIDVLINAIHKVSDDGLYFTLVGGAVHGDAPSENIPHTTFTGWLSSDNLVPYFQYADVLVMPSRWEGFSMVALEAMSHGLPILASNCSSLPEMIHHGYNGLLFNPEDDNDLLLYLKTTNKKSWGRMGENAKLVFESKYTAMKMLEDTEKVYRRVLNK